MRVDLAGLVNRPTCVSYFRALVSLKCVSIKLKVRIDIYLLIIFGAQNGLQQADALSSLPFNFAVQNATEKFQVYQDRLKLNGTHQLPVYANYVNLLDENINITCKNTRFISR